MKKFWIIIFIALFGGIIIGDSMRAFFFDTTARARPFFSREREDDGIAVIGKHLDGFASVLLAAAGKNKGVNVDDLAITLDGEYVGRVNNVSSELSQIILASRPGERFAGWLPVLSAPLDMEGWGSGFLRASVPASFPIEAGDEVWYDARLDALVGTVIAIKEIKNTDDDSMKEILVRHAINPLMLSSVFIRP